MSDFVSLRHDDLLWFYIAEDCAAILLNAKDISRYAILWLGKQAQEIVVFSVRQDMLLARRYDNE
jgi:hypothetical protein